MDAPNSGPSAPTDDQGPVLKLNAKELLEFVSKHTDTDRTSFDRLLKWFGVAATGLIALAGFFGYQSKRDVDATAAAVREEAKAQIQAEVSKETNEQNIQKYITAAIEKRTEAQFQDAIAKAVAAQLETAERQKFLQTAVQQQVDGWFAKHPDVIQAAAQKQVDILTEQLQGFVKILQLGAAAVTPSSKSGPALRSLRDLAHNSPNNSFKELANAQLNIAAGYWGVGNSFIGFSTKIKSLDEKGEKAPYKTCDLLALLGSPSWEDRSRAAYAFTLSLRYEKGVPEALLHAMTDDYLEVAFRAGRALAMLTGREGLQQTFPEMGEFQKWWKEEGEPALASKLKPLECK